VVLTAGDSERVLFGVVSGCKCFWREISFGRAGFVLVFPEPELVPRMSRAMAGHAFKDIVGSSRGLMDAVRGLRGDVGLNGEDDVGSNSTFLSDLVGASDGSFRSNRFDRPCLTAGVTRRRSSALGRVTTLAL